MAEINILLRATDEASNVIAKAGNNISTSMKSVEETSNQVTKAQQEHEASTKQLALGMNNLATSAFGLYDAVDRVQDMQVSVNRANLQVKSSLNAVEDAQSLGIETLRNLYSAANLTIRPKTQINRIEQLKEIIRAWGQNPEEILTKDALMRGNITETSDKTQNHQLSLLAEQLKQLVKKEVSE